MRISRITAVVPLLALVVALGAGPAVAGGTDDGRKASYCPRVEKAFDTVIRFSENPLGFQDIFGKAAKQFKKAAKVAPESIASDVREVAKFLRKTSQLEISELGDIGEIAEDVTEPYQDVLADAQVACGLEISNVPLFS